MKNVCVIGSLNMDMVLSMNRLPQLGETLIANQLDLSRGGKGGNQACAAARMGCQVTMIGCVGEDPYGEELIMGLKEDGITTEHIKRVKGPSGTAIITVDQIGNNTIVVVPGANDMVSSQQVENLKHEIQKAEVVIAQFETPMEASSLAFKYAKEAGGITILNPAPYAKVSHDLIRNTDMIIPNETEAYELTGIEVRDAASARKAAENMLAKGVQYVIITLGEEGAILVSKENCQHIPAYKVAAIDTTAAGDSFIGAVASRVNKDNINDFEKIVEIIGFGNRVSSFTVTREGAQSSIPTLKEVESLIKEVNP